MDAAGFSASIAAGLGTNIAALFNYAVECFEYVQLGRNLAQDSGTSQLKLDSARLRLSRWGEAVNIYSNANAPSFPKREFRQTRRKIYQIIDLFTKAEGISNAFKSKNTSSNTALAILDPAKDMNSEIFALHNQMRNLAVARQRNAQVLQNTRVFQNTRWALYEKRHFEEFFNDITFLIGDFERICPPTQDGMALGEKLQRLCQDEVKIMRENTDMSLLEDVVMDQDPCLLEAIKKSLRNSEEKKISVSFAGSNTRGFQLGHNSGSVWFPGFSEVNITSPHGDYKTAPGVGGCSTDATNLSTSAGKDVATLTSHKDDQTYDSEVSGVSNAKIKEFINGFAEELSEKCRPKIPDERSRYRAIMALPGLLESFAFRLRQNVDDKMHADIMLCTPKYRGEIVAHFEKSLGLQEDQDDCVDEQKGDYVPNYSVHREQFVGTPAYQWLLAELNKEMQLELEGSGAIHAVRHAVRHAVTSSLSLSETVSANGPSGTRQLTFEIAWNPKTFLEEQQFLEDPREATTINQLMDPSEAVERAITITGSAKDAQVLTTEQYLRQTWPTTGQWILKVVKDVVAMEHGLRISYTMPDNTRLTGWMEDSKFFMQACGIGLSLAELGEQLAWLSTALRSSPYRDGIALCTPFIHDFHPDTDQANAVPSLSCRIDFNRSKIRQTPTPAEGQCWHNMFRNPVLVEGFPIPRRSHSNTGLEIPLNVMVALADTDYVTEFNRKPFIKGFSTILVPTMMANDILVWHLLYAKDRGRISYWDVTVPHLAVGKAELESKRHIVGWCSEAKLLAGTKHANYSLKTADLPRPSRDCLLDRATISGGYQVTAAFSFALGQAHKPVRVELSGYLDQLAWAHETFVVFWDENEKRGWLVNGTTALLHIVRTLLQHKCSGPFKSTILLEPNQIPEASDENKFSTDAALEVLCDVSNRIRPVQLDDIKIEKKTVQEAGGTPKETTEKKEIHTTFQDVVQRTCKVLEQMVDQQNPADRNGFSMKCRARKHIDGWDFESFLDKRTSYPSVATFEAMGHGWVDFIGGLGAVTLFAKGFGEIIEPTRTEGFCSRWAKLPKERYYLAACCSDLIKATKLPSMAGSDLEKLSRSVKFSELCSCGYTSHAGQPTLLPHSSLQFKGCTLLPHRGTVSLQSQGAMIFSHNIPLKWRWKSPARSILEDTRPSDVSDPLFDDGALSSSQVRSHHTETASESSQEPEQLPIERSATDDRPISVSVGEKSTEPKRLRSEESHIIATQDVPSQIGTQKPREEQTISTQAPQQPSRDQSSPGETSTASGARSRTLPENSVPSNHSKKGRKHRTRKLLPKFFKKEYWDSVLHRKSR